MRLVKKFRKSFVILVLFPALLFSYSANSSLFLMDIGAKNSALGYAGIASSDNVESVFLNPATIGSIENLSIAIGYSPILFNMYNYYFAIVKKNNLIFGNNIESIGINCSYLSVGNGFETDATGSILGELSTYQYLAGIIYSLKFISINKNDFYLAINIKYLRNHLTDAYNGSGFSFDIGLQYFPAKVKSLQVGIVYKNLASYLTGINESESLPSILGAGMVYNVMEDNTIFAQTLNLLLDFKVISDEGSSVNTGLDYQIFNILSLRLGYRYYNNINANNYSFGMGINYEDRYRVNYTFLPEDEQFGGSLHQISLGVEF